MKCPKCFTKMDVYGVEVFDAQDTKLKSAIVEIPMVAYCPRCDHAERDIELDTEP